MRIMTEKNVATTKDKKITVRLTTELYEKLKEEADRKGLGLATYIRFLLFERYDNEN